MKRIDMKTNYRRVPTEFGPETRFVVEPLPAGPFRAVRENNFETLKRKLLAERLGETFEPSLNSQLRRAANEAAALAWVTSYPLLVFPTLFDEKAEAAERFVERQAQILERSRELLAV